MLNVGMKRSKAVELSNRIEWKLGNAESLVNEKDNSYDVNKSLKTFPFCVAFFQFLLLGVYDSFRNKELHSFRQR